MDEAIVEQVEPDEQEESPPPAVNRGNGGKWILIGLLLVGGVIGFFIFQHLAKGKAATDKSPPPQVGVSISTAIAEKGSIGVYIMPWVP